LFVDEEALPDNKAEVSGVGFQVSGADKEKVSGLPPEADQVSGFRWK
jgi:hypothetical protein